MELHLSYLQYIYISAEHCVQCICVRLYAHVFASSKFPKVYTRTKRYCSFINYALNNYQDKL